MTHIRHARSRMFRSIAGFITPNIRDDHGQPLARMTLEDALPYVRELDRQLRRAARVDDIERVVFFRCAKRDLEAAIYEAAGFVKRKNA